MLTKRGDMKYNIAINGCGRIGRCIIRALYENPKFYEAIRLVAVNEMAEAEVIYHLTKFDSTHGRFPVAIDLQGSGDLLIGRDQVKVFQRQAITQLPWQELQVDAVLECTGAFHDRQAAEQHLAAGAGKVLFSHPAKDEMDATIVYGVNHQSLRASDTVISNASCTTNCVIPILHVLDKAFGLRSGTITTIHSAMHDQPVIDAYDNDLRKTRSAIQSIIPVSTALERGIARLLPKLAGRFETLAVRVPVANVSLMDIAVNVEKDTDIAAVNWALADAAGAELRGVLGVTDEQLVSCDFNHDPRSAIVDLHQTRVSGQRLLKIQAWFDNEWGYSNRMLDTVLTMAAL